MQHDKSTHDSYHINSFHLISSKVRVTLHLSLIAAMTEGERRSSEGGRVGARVIGCLN